MQKIIWIGLSAVGMGVGASRGAPVVADFAHVQQVATYPTSVVARIRPLRFFFSHASVGGNMVDGLDDLHASDAARYPLQVYYSCSDFPPVPTLNGCVHEYGRGNPGWQEKMDWFADYVDNGWRFPQVNIAIDKLCYIDQDADVSYYLTTMTNLEARNPETLFAYATMPLTTDSDEDNYRRNLYNDAVRAWVTNRNAVLFDIADIEAHYTNGTHYTFTYSGRTCQRLCPSYTTDGGHLDDGTLGRKQVAKGFYSLAIQLFGVDRDGDGVSDGDELLAGTRFRDAGSVLRVSAGLAGAGRIRLQWPGASNRTYFLDRSTNLLAGAGFVPVRTNGATPPLNTCTDAPPAAVRAGFYRLRVQQ